MAKLKRYSGKGGNVVIPEGRFNVIGSEAFTGRNDIFEVTIPDSITEIEAGAFDNCPSVRVTYKGRVYTSSDISGLYSGFDGFEIEDDDGFEVEEDSSSEDFEIENGVLKFYKWVGGNVVIPNGVTTIGDYAFRDCTSLTSVTIPNSVTKIGMGAFNGCKSLTSVTIPNSVITIGISAFAGCKSLTSVTIPNSVTAIGVGAFFECASLTSVTIPNSVISINARAFAGCTSLTSVTIPDSVTEIARDAFLGCTSLQT